MFRETSVFEQYMSSVGGKTQEVDGASGCQCRPPGGYTGSEGDDVFADRSESPSSSESEFFSLEEDQVRLINI